MSAATLTANGSPTVLTPPDSDTFNPPGYSYTASGYAVVPGTGEIAVIYTGHNATTYNSDFAVVGYSLIGGTLFQDPFAIESFAVGAAVIASSPDGAIAIGYQLVGPGAHFGQASTNYAVMSAGGQVLSNGYLVPPENYYSPLNLQYGSTDKLVLQNWGVNQFQLRWDAGDSGFDLQTNQVQFSQYISSSGALVNGVQASSDLTIPVISVASDDNNGTFLTVIDNHVDLRDWNTDYVTQIPNEPAHAITSAADAALADNQFAVAWVDSGTDYAAIYDPSTHSFGAVAGLDWGGATDVHLVALPDGGFAVSWMNGGAYKGEVFDLAGSGGGVISLAGDVGGIDSHGQLYTVGLDSGGPPITLAPGFEVRVGGRLQLRNEPNRTCIYKAPEVQYVYDRSGAQRDSYAWRGLANSGPYDRQTFPKKSPRILAVFPTTSEGKVDVFLKALRDGMAPPQRAFANGFAKTFGLVNPEFIRCPVRLNGVSADKVEEAYRNAIQAHLARDANIDAGVIVLLDEHAHLPELQNPYIRTKALLLTLGIPTQEVRMSTVTQRPVSLQYILQNISVSLYAKLNGTPWTVDQDRAISDEIVVGMGVTELSGSRLAARQRFVGITTVFGGDGTYLLGAVSRECAFEDYASAVRDSMVAVLEDVRNRNNWQPGDTIRVIFHAHKPLKRVEVAEIAFACAKQVGAAQTLQMAFVTVSQDHPFFLFDPKEPGIPVSRDSDVKKGVLAPGRGTITRIGRATRLLAVNSHTLIKRANSPLPKPLLISLHEDSTFFDLDYLAEQVLKFTALSWRSTLPAGTPVTIFYSERIAELLARLRLVPDWSATALAVRLRWSRWFL